MDELAPGGLAGVAIRFERRDDRVHIAGRQCALVVRHDTLRAQIRIALQQGRAMHVTTRQGPDAVVDPELDEPTVGAPVGDDRDRNVHSLTVTVEVENDFLESPRLREYMLDRIERHAAL